MAAGLPVVLQDGTNTYVYGLGLISATDGSGTQTYYLSDALGSTTDLADGSANSVAAYSYDVFGAIRAQTGSSSNYWLFTGEQRDAESSFEYLRARYYDPATGRFLSKDPLSGQVASPQTQNRYTYVTSNPVSMIDPTGLYGYDLDFNLGNLGGNGPERAMALLQTDFSVWPFRVYGAQGETTFQEGHTYDLYFDFFVLRGVHLPRTENCTMYFVCGPEISGPNPIEVESIKETSMTFRSLPGHSEGAGNRITFSTRLDANGNTRLDIHAEGPWTWRDLPGLKYLIQTAPLLKIWNDLQSNLRDRLQES